MYLEARQIVFTDQICEQSGYAMTSLPVLQNHFRILIISSSSSLLQSALFDLKKTLLQNGYPRSVLCYNINHVLKTKETLLIGELEPSLNENVGSEKLFLYLFLLVVSTIGSINFVIVFYLVTSSPLYFCIF